ncbi:probable BOI-related E3 ubiquitin-protein ligase 3 [Mangifera indica]|uniref:probable BOI-related E3 ubiquitin-protein ligase 3 n=1 Tax=Mangifera indica TaxID=29780 RepID=UPI001CF973B2|nr:probable BOI-related E3 ubiquitin-protein ligase 3 [Mangifera indica]
MAVEARHHNLFPPQLLGNREMNPIESNASFYNTQMGYGLPLSGTTTGIETLQLPATVYGSGISDSLPQKPVIKSDSSLTYNNSNNLLVQSRKRSRDFCNPPLSFPSFQNQSHKTCTAMPFSFFGHDISPQIQEQQSDLDRIISQHMEKVKMEIEERRKRQARRILDAIEESLMKKLRIKEEEIEKMGKLNWALEERVKSLCIENQIWRDLAQSNEATANALRSNLEQVLAATQANDARTPGGGCQDDEVIDDAQSCCGSSCDGDDQKRRLDSGDNSSGMCRNCRKEEACVLLLPCRHLCLCTVCGSGRHTCPVCNSVKTGSVHVNMS